MTQLFTTEQVKHTNPLEVVLDKEHMLNVWILNANIVSHIVKIVKTALTATTYVNSVKQCNLHMRSNMLIYITDCINIKQL